MQYQGEKRLLKGTMTPFFLLIADALAFKAFFSFFCSQVIVPTKELLLAGKDAAAEYDELAEPQDFQDDPE